MDVRLNEMTHLVQYRQTEPTNGFDPWHTMAAFDCERAARAYCEAQERGVYEYRVVPVDAQ